jgi:hypothetical protein
VPSSVIKSFAEKSGHSVSDVEKLWDESKVEAAKKFKEDDSKFWAYVNATTQRKLGLGRKKTSFKQHLETDKS